MPLGVDADAATLAAKQAITEVMHAYCRGLDRRDRALLDACFHPDATTKYTTYEGPVSTFMDFAMQVLGGLVASHHQLGNVMVEVEGDQAITEAYFTAFHRLAKTGDPAFDGAKPDSVVLIGGRYIDRFEKRSGVWRIAHRIGIFDWRHDAPAEDAGFLDSEDPAVRGVPDHRDALYSIWPGPGRWTGLKG